MVAAVQAAHVVVGPLKDLRPSQDGHPDGVAVPVAEPCAPQRIVDQVVVLAGPAGDDQAGVPGDLLERVRERGGGVLGQYRVEGVDEDVDIAVGLTQSSRERGQARLGETGGGRERGVGGLSRRQVGVGRDPGARYEDDRAGRVVPQMPGQFGEEDTLSEAALSDEEHGAAVALLQVPVDDLQP